jgi:dienelactone hydrolase
MKLFRSLMIALSACWCGAALAQQAVSFPSLGDNGTAPPTTLTGYLFRPSGDGPRPALVFLHGCEGMFRGGTFKMRDTSWANYMVSQGYVVLMVDSFGPRHQEKMCSPATYNDDIYHKRGHDAYGALVYLQAQSFVQTDKIGLMGWSEGGGVALNAIRTPSIGRPPNLAPARDFKVALTFYPQSCSDREHKQPWATRIPILILMGAADIWTSAGPCEQFVQAAQSRGQPIQAVFYPDAYHDFDDPTEPVHRTPEFAKKDGTIPIVGANPAVRADAFSRASAFLNSYLHSR